MKLLYITSQSGQRINGFMRSAIIAARELGIDFTIACNMEYADRKLYAEDCQYYGIKTVHIDCDRNPLMLKNYTVVQHQLVSLMKEEHYDIVHCNTPIGGVLGRICARKVQIPYVIYQAHGFHFWKGAPVKNWLLYYPVERILAHYTDMLITINTADFEQAQKFHLKKNGKVVKIPGVGVDLSEFDVNLRFTENGKAIRTALREKWMLDKDAKIFVSVGELNSNKNHEVAIRAFAKADIPNSYYIICGKGSKKEYLINLAKKLGVGDKVYLLGYQDNIAEILLACDCFLFTSFREGLPGALMEAMASGIPCIASNIRGCTDLLEKSEYLFDPRNSNELASKMISIIDDEKSRKEIERNSKHVIEFDLEHAVRSLKSLYERVGD